MTALEHAITNLEKLRDCFRVGTLDRAIVQAELAGFVEVRDGVPAEPSLYFGFLARYQQAKEDARLLGGNSEERETQPLVGRRNR
jgi:hypothetical protein